MTPTLSLEQAREHCFIGMEAACSDAFLFADARGLEIRSEALIAVSIAKAFYSSADGELVNAGSITVKMETPAIQFARACVPQLAGDLLDMRVPGDVNDVERRGRIDVTIWAQDSPVCAIEVKGIGPSKGRTMADLVRNAQLLVRNDANTGPSRLPYSLFACMTMDGRSYRQVQRERGISQCRKRFDGYAASLAADYPDLEVHVDARTLDSLLIDERGFLANAPADALPDPLGEVYHCVGIVVSMRRKPA